MRWASTSLCMSPVDLLGGGGQLGRAGCARQGGLRMHRQRHGRTGSLGEVEICGDVSEDADIFSDVWPWVGPTVGAGINALTAEQILLDELVVGVERECLVIDIPLLGVGADDHGRHSQAVSAVSYTHLTLPTNREV